MGLSLFRFPRDLGQDETIGEASVFGGQKRGVAVTAGKPVKLLVHAGRPNGSTPA